ncbi:hypothetical protein NE664_00500 [Anaerotignum faecicola]|nr:hypothetical protein [Anaerotignum faecicola]
MTIYKKLFIGFLSGLVLMGAGAGIAFAEFSSFSYGGQKTISDSFETKTLTVKMDSSKERYFFQTYYYPETGISIETDSNVPADEIIIEASVNKMSAAVPVISINNDLKEENINGNHSVHENMEYSSYNGSYVTISQIGENDVVFDLSFNYHGYNGVSNFFMAKDEFLNSVKERKIYDYNYSDVEKVTIKVAPENKDKVSLLYW